MSGSSLLAFPMGELRPRKTRELRWEVEMDRCVVSTRIQALWDSTPNPGQVSVPQFPHRSNGNATTLASQGDDKDETQVVYDIRRTVPSLARGPQGFIISSSSSSILIIMRRKPTSGLELQGTVISVLPKPPAQAVKATRTANTHMALLLCEPHARLTGTLSHCLRAGAGCQALC